MMQASAGATELFVWKMIPGLILLPEVVVWGFIFIWCQPACTFARPRRVPGRPPSGSPTPPSGGRGTSPRSERTGSPAHLYHQLLSCRNRLESIVADVADLCPRSGPRRLPATRTPAATVKAAQPQIGVNFLCLPSCWLPRARLNRIAHPCLQGAAQVLDPDYLPRSRASRLCQPEVRHVTSSKEAFRSSCRGR